MLEVGGDEILVMERMIHAEALESILDEINLSKPVIIDIVKQLLHHRYIKALDSSNQQKLTVNMDAILKVKFQLTAKGLKELEVR